MNTNDRKQKAIDEKIRFIEEKTGEKVTIEQGDNINVDALTDFSNWNNIGLPKIRVKRGVASDSVHLLHELIHLEKFFVDQYSIIACNNRNLHQVIDVFKNIPEDYVAHKVIFEDYGFNPIKETWFSDKNILDGHRSNNQLAADLIQYYFFAEFYPNYRNELSTFREECKRQRNQAFFIFDKVVSFTSSVDHRNRADYTRFVNVFIEEFEPDYFQSHRIYPSYFSKEQGTWKWNP